MAMRRLRSVWWRCFGTKTWFLRLREQPGLNCDQPFWKPTSPPASLDWPTDAAVRASTVDLQSSGSRWTLMWRQLMSSKEYEIDDELLPYCAQLVPAIVAGNDADEALQQSWEALWHAHDAPPLDSSDWASRFERSCGWKESSGYSKYNPPIVAEFRR